MVQDLPLRPGDTLVTAQLSPCLGGLLRTWVDGEAPRLWTTPDAEWLAQAQATGSIARAVREERRFREVGMLSERDGTLVVQNRFPTEGETIEVDAHVVRLEPAEEPAARPGDHVADELLAVLRRAVLQCLAHSEFLVVEKGGWDAPVEPFCLFAVVPEEGRLVSVVETAPAPYGSSVWEPRIVPGRPSTSLSAAASPDTIEVVPILMVEAINRWGLEPWDLALTFGQR